MKDGKFHPHSQYKKGTRKSREQNKKSEGVKIRKKISVGDNPEGTKLNKFIDKGGEGLRGTLVARTKNGKRGIILAQNSAFAKGGASWGKLYEVVEKKPNQYPVVKKQVDKIPDTKDWEILTTRKKRYAKEQKVPRNTEVIKVKGTKKEIVKKLMETKQWNGFENISDDGWFSGSIYLDNGEGRSDYAVYRGLVSDGKVEVKMNKNDVPSYWRDLYYDDLFMEASDKVKDIFEEMMTERKP